MTIHNHNTVLVLVLVLGFFFFFFKGRELLLGMALDFRLLIKKLLESMTIHNQERVYYTFTNMGLNSKKL